VCLKRAISTSKSLLSCHFCHKIVWRAWASIAWTCLPWAKTIPFELASMSKLPKQFKCNTKTIVQIFKKNDINCEIKHKNCFFVLFEAILISLKTFCQLRSNCDPVEKSLMTVLLRLYRNKKAFVPQSFFETTQKNWNCVDLKNQFLTE